MPALGLAVATDIVAAALTFYVRGKALSQTMQDKPLLKFLEGGKQTFPSGKDKISEPVQGAYMSDTAGFFSGYSEDDGLTFAQASNLLRAEADWKETHAGLMITWTELKKDGLTLLDGNKMKKHSDAGVTQLTSILENRLEDFGESYSRMKNLMFWKNGAQDAKQIPGIRYLFPNDPANGTTLGLSRANPDGLNGNWWQHTVGLNIAFSGANQTLTKTLRSDSRIWRKRGGKPDKALAGSTFLDALDEEIAEKGVYTQEGFAKDGKTEFGMADVTMRGLGKFEYDPTLDDMGMGNYCFIMDSRRVKLRPMEGEEDKMLTPERPYNYLVFIRSLTWTGALHCTQLNANAVYSVAQA